MSKQLTEIEAAILVRMSPTLLRWFTSHAPKHGSKRKLPFIEKGGEYLYNEDELIGFDSYLKDPWPKPPKAQRPHVPEGIAREILVEANHKCAFCDRSHSGEGAHIDPVRKGGCNHPHNLIWSCPNHHTEYDLGYKIETVLTKEHVRFLKQMLLDGRLRHWHIELRTVSHFLAILEDLRKISECIERDELATLRPKLAELATSLVATAVESAKAASAKRVKSPPSYVRYAEKIAALSLPRRNVTSGELKQTERVIDEATDEYLEESGLVTCPLCAGSGEHNRHRCPICRDAGTVDRDQVGEIDLRPYRQVVCPLCKGTGDHNRFDCPVCFGIGTVDAEGINHIDLKPFAQMDCPLCDGSGDHNRFECPVCKGVGTIDSAHEVDLRPFKQVECPVCDAVGDRQGHECEFCHGVGTVDRDRAENADLTPYRQVKCPVCDGKGYRRGGQDCPPCRGTGKIDEGLLDTLDLSQYEQTECPACQGTGTRKGRECRFCDGTGKTDRGAADNFEGLTDED